MKAKDLGRKILAILSDVEAWLVFAAILIVGLLNGLILGWVAGIVVYLVVNLWRSERPRFNFFGITPPSNDPPPQDPPDGDQ